MEAGRRALEGVKGARRGSGCLADRCPPRSLCTAPSMLETPRHIAPAAERTAWEIRGNKHGVYTHIPVYHSRETKTETSGCVVGGIGSPPKHPRLSYPIHLLFSNSLNRQIRFLRAQRMSACYPRDRKESGYAFTVTPRGMFLHVISDRSLLSRKW